ncbi:FKBP-type peptidyl-prolyl cis-trans isomerase [Chitinophaga sp. YR573]|uniref:FKBP-type peptidyl-prolyl cis-trans isomerase n=1 Tax=Chitinophaga sp. YR573 TaxID=1881040 RepID=UPI0008B1D58A|nr:FKBP-type peptidyl-prolyl cis-trans isomerase [Chitinophaga sp. YR573]SEV90552.1 FKBP-type peptidyl-prolyl cis-trans isomerase [Chitinophaga sp. YR573]
MKVILRYCLLLLLLSGCSKSDSSEMDALETLYKEDVIIRAYIEAHGLTDMVKDSSGLYYKIQEPGDSVHMTLNSVPTIIYSRSNIQDSLLDASFGSTNFDGRKLKDHIVGWQIVLQKIGKGGKIFTIIPSPLAFGDEAVGNIIAANSILVCEIEVVDFK